MTDCPHGDPHCPCQDGDACHYEDVGDSKAWPVPKESVSVCNHPRPGRVLYLADPYCWYPLPDVREYITNTAYSVLMDPCLTCLGESRTRA